MDIMRLNIPRDQKKTVRYFNPPRGWATDNVVVGERAVVIPIDHPSPFVTNGQLCYTSPVLAYNKDTDEIETVFTIYIRIRDNDEQIDSTKTSRNNQE